MAARHPKSFLPLDDANYLLMRRSDAIYVANLIAAWRHRYISTTATELTKTH
jgi:putative redox protein